MLEEFYRVAFRKTLYTSIEQLQNDVDVGLRPAVGVWIDSYNCNRPHSGRYCYGKTPMQTFLDSKSLVDEKMLHRWLEQAEPSEAQALDQHGDEKETNETSLTPFLSVR
jgi:hypothetical protein